MAPYIFSFISLLSPGFCEAAIFGPVGITSPGPSTMHHQLARATAVAVLSANIEPDPEGGLRLDAPDGSFLCPGEPFATEPSLSYACSGFLIAPDLLVTAGHCSVNVGEAINETEMYCQAFGWLFDYLPNEQGEVSRNQIPAEKYYRCKKIIYAVREEAAPFRDYALIQLERPVLDRTPLKLAETALQEGAEVFTIGYPMGVPAKLSSGAKVLLNAADRESLITNLDAVAGFSGSAVFNGAGEVAGILVGGTPSMDFVSFAGEKCERFNRCDENGENCLVPDTDTSVFPGFQRIGTEVQKIAPIAELLKSLR